MSMTPEEQRTDLEQRLKQLSDAYFQLRRKLGRWGSFDTPYAPSLSQVWETTERALDKLLKEVAT